MSKKKETIVFAVIIAVLVIAIILIICFAKGCKSSDSGNKGGNSTVQGDKDTEGKKDPDNNSGNGLQVDPDGGDGDSIDFNDIINGNADSDTKKDTDYKPNPNGGLTVGDDPDKKPDSNNTDKNNPNTPDKDNPDTPSNPENPDVPSDDDPGYGPLF